MAPPRPSRYAWWPLRVVDGATVVLTLPLTHSLSLAASCYCLTTHDSTSGFMLFLRFAVAGPVLFILFLLALVPGLVGWLVWVALNTCAAHLIQPFYYHTPRHPPATCHLLPGEASLPLRVTLCSANVLLCPEGVSRFNNCPNVFWRVKEIGRRLMQQDWILNKHPNLQPPVCREQVVVSQVPEVDIFLLQEVVERWHCRRLVRAFRDTYPYCVYDVGLHTTRSNFFLCGSGLFLASKFPVLDCVFHPFTNYSHYGCVVGLGVLLAKLDLGVVVRAGEGVRAVGYVANTHTQAYQGERNIVCRQLTEVEGTFTQYVHDTHDTHTEVLMFAVLGGDFNVDNMSKGDQAAQNLPLWEEFLDPCRRCAGKDEEWAVGTEHRQRQLHHPVLRHPSTFRSVMLDDKLRRHFILDADVEKHTLHLTCVQPRPDASGQVRATPDGGRRRIDRLLLWKRGRMRPTGYWFTTAIAGLTDHIPVVMMLDEKMQEEEDQVKEKEEEEEEREEKKNV